MCLFIERYRFNDVVVVTEVMREIYKKVLAIIWKICHNRVIYGF